MTGLGGPKIDLTGRRFGRWTVSRLVTKHAGHAYKWECTCDCGRVREVVGATLKNGASRSCGCLQREVVKAMATKHGGGGTPEYRAWKHLRGRCSDPNDKRFANYGGRGISVCERWNDFAAFLADVGKRPSLKHSIERKDVNGNYEPGNVVWATMAEQAANKTTTSYVCIDGHVGKLVDIAAELGVGTNTLHKRAQRGSFGVSYVPAP